ncbi:MULTISPECIES: methylated-DNA--[protein]-cysteine S-methyltransferase [unclassified Streptomyces]|uniref:methylated-DNA--[protein]-cysteine S-methyltransferase n=1 Tax=unclassified Streptomyces TaxID=2593676 RepID=UPI00224CD2F8|nr:MULTISPECIES: methylated-DNA--[protein]-cysteine S-methyltransferase [unclassified Streptomyces]MCX4885804.1 methylated-DNA--[protein]-cysteine S-methyltransferase [Streptomyces sp. NBC_00847]MCX5064080.1 methylated-DNA--[protein]-cysteine S-methyltransferase [Streptomyces sp. NBC_00452]MCX5251501.1 methylated-DNA--[protein]-cysteine S-methyltransferase [Streptomyces sp. NBC_00201]MCX5294575.1 methylated-DNA--[protein]-cysteine S-methyltransferase [Streptomyces sp. NBC_00183]
MTTYTKIDSPVGELLLVGEGTTLTSLSVPAQRNAPVVRADWRRDDEAFGEAARQLSAYFEGRLIRFDLSLAPEGTEFQQRVWRALDEIPYGTTTTYGALASLLDVPRAEIRAVGAAIGANPLLVVRPCHRVIGADGSMRGYAGGVERKVRLLTHEGALQQMLV